MWNLQVKFEQEASHTFAVQTDPIAAAWGKGQVGRTWPKLEEEKTQSVQSDGFYVGLLHLSI